MDDQDVNPYSLLAVIVDSHELNARPTQFDTDGEGNVLKATHYETACPYCGHLISFQLNQVRSDKRIGCDGCKRGFNQGSPEQLINPTVSVVVVKKTGQKIEKEVPYVAPVECPFIDPIECGTFHLTGLLSSDK
jgi:hypothetical protein